MKPWGPVKKCGNLQQKLPHDISLLGWHTLYFGWHILLIWDGEFPVLIGILRVTMYVWYSVPRVNTQQTNKQPNVTIIILWSKPIFIVVLIDG